MTSPNPDRRALAQAEAIGAAVVPAERNTFLKIIQILHRKERLAASGAAFERFDPKAPGIRPGRRQDFQDSFTG